MFRNPIRRSRKSRVSVGNSFLVTVFVSGFRISTGKLSTQQEAPFGADLISLTTPSKVIKMGSSAPTYSSFQFHGASPGDAAGYLAVWKELKTVQGIGLYLCVGHDCPERLGDFALGH